MHLSCFCVQPHTLHTEQIWWVFSDGADANDSICSFKVCCYVSIANCFQTAFEICSCRKRLYIEASSSAQNEATRKRGTVQVSTFEIALFDSIEWDALDVTRLCVSSMCGSIYVWAGGGCVCVCLFYLMLMRDRMGTRGQVQGTTVCRGGIPAGGNVFKIYYPHS